MSRSSGRYYAHTMPGVEEIAWLEIRARLEKVKFGSYLFAKEQNGIVLFDYDGRPEDLLRLRTTEDVFVHALSLDKVSRDWRDLRLIANKVQKSAEFGHSVDKLLRLRKPKSVPTYRVVARKYGRHEYKRKDLEQAILKGVRTRYPRWRSTADGANIEIWANLLGSRLLVGLRLSDRSMRHRFKKVVELAGSLRPSVAAAMVHLTQPEPGDRFLDPMCGSGTLLLERQYSGAYGYVIGGDLSAERSLAAWRNLASQRKDIHQKAIAVVNLDGRYLPFLSEAIDKVATNLPFGKQHGSPEEVRRLYPPFFVELERVLRPGGRAVILSSEYELVKQAVRHRSKLVISSGYSVAVLGQWGRIYVIDRVP